MATDKKQVEIPGRLHSVATEGVVAGANEILDDNKGKNQQEINASVDDSLQENKTNIANEITRATNAENAIKGGSSKSIQNLDSRLSTVEAHDTISMDGGSVVVGTAEDFTNRTTAGDAKIPTVGAILNSADDEPTIESGNLVKSGGVAESLQRVPLYKGNIISTGVTLSRTLIPKSSYNSILLRVYPGDKFYINGRGGTSINVYATYDIDGNRVRLSDTQIYSGIFEIAETECYLVLNLYVNYGYKVYYVTSPISSRQFYEVESSLEEVESSLEEVAEVVTTLNVGRNDAIKYVGKRVSSSSFASGRSYLLHLIEGDILFIKKGASNTVLFLFENNPETTGWDYSQMNVISYTSIASSIYAATITVEKGKEYWALIGGSTTDFLPSELVLNGQSLITETGLVSNIDNVSLSLPNLIKLSRNVYDLLPIPKMMIGALNSLGNIVSSTDTALNIYPIPANCIVELNEGYKFAKNTYSVAYYDFKSEKLTFFKFFPMDEDTKIFQFYTNDANVRFSIKRVDEAALTEEELDSIIKKVTFVEPSASSIFGVRNTVRDRYKNFISNVDYTDVPYTTSYIGDSQYAALSMARAKNAMPVVLNWIALPSAEKYLVQLTTNSNAYTFADNKYAYETDKDSVSIYNLMPNTKYYYTIFAIVKGEMFPYGIGAFNTENFPIRPINMPEVDNMRDLGGWAIGSAQRVRYGRLYRGASGNRSDNWPLTGAGRIDACVRLGITTEFDIGADGALTKSCITDRTAFNVLYCQSYPMAGMSNNSNYLNYPRALHYIVNRLNANSNIWFHCSGGADRTGSVAFVLNALLGVSESDLSKDYELTSFSFSRNQRARNSSSYPFKDMVAYFKSIVVPDNPNAELKDKVAYWLMSAQEFIPVEEGINITNDIAAFRSIMIESL